MASPRCRSAPAARAADPDADRATDLHAGLGAVNPDETRTIGRAGIAGTASLQREQPTRGSGFVGFLTAGRLGDGDWSRQQHRDKDRKQGVSHPAFYRVQPAFATERT